MAMTVGFAASLLAAAPLTATASAAEQPTYTCAADRPMPLIYPPPAFGIRCTASPGAPTEGRVNERIKLIIEDPTFVPFPRGEDGSVRLSCGRADVHQSEDEDGLVVNGWNCSREGEPTYS